MSPRKKVPIFPIEWGGGGGGWAGGGVGFVRTLSETRAFSPSPLQPGQNEKMK